MPGIIYRPPEFLAASEKAAAAGAAAVAPAAAAADIWAFGVIAYELLTGTPAFPHGSSRTDICDQVSGRAPLPWEEGSDSRGAIEGQLGNMHTIVLRCLSRATSERPTAQGVVRAIEAQQKARWADE